MRRQASAIPNTDLAGRYHARKWNESLGNFALRISKMCQCNHPHTEHVPIFGCIADAEQWDVSCTCHRYRKARRENVSS